MFMLAKAPIGVVLFPVDAADHQLDHVVSIWPYAGIMIGSAVGMVCVSARILLGIDRSHLGLGQD
jgi:hypothetical protein